MPSQSELKSGIQALLGLSESELEGELGKRLAQTADELNHDAPLTVTHATGPTIDRAGLQSLPDFTRRVAQRFLSKFDAQMYSLICDARDPDNQKIRTAAVQGTEALGYVIGGVLIATFGWLPGIATVIAVIIAKRAANAGYQAFCETWKERL